MYIALYHFKNYTDTTLQLASGIQLIIGNNGSGKSTLCEALAIIANAANSHPTSWSQKASFGEQEAWALRWEIDNTLFQAIFSDQDRFPKWSIDEENYSKRKYEDKMPFRAF